VGAEADEEDLAATNKLLSSLVLVMVLFFSEFEPSINSGIESMDLLGNGGCISCQAFFFSGERERGNWNGVGVFTVGMAKNRRNKKT
jgi:hypothetical protein